LCQEFIEDNWNDEQTCKFWLEPIALASNLGFSAKELRHIENLVINNQQDLLEARNGYFKD